MPFIKPGDPITANVSNEDLTAAFCFDKFNTAAEGEEPVIAKFLRCDIAISNQGDASDESKGFQITKALTDAQVTTLKGLLAKCRDYALVELGYIES